MPEYLRDEDYRYVPGRLKRRDGTWLPLPQHQYYLMRYTWRLKHYHIWVRLEAYEGIKDDYRVE